MVGVSEAVGRLVSVGFSVASVWLIYLLGRRLFGVAVGRGAALLLAFSPSSVYFGRTLLSDVPMITFSIAAVLGYAVYFETERRRDAILGAVWFALAGLVKLPAILILGPVVWLGWLTRRWRLAGDSWFVVGIIAALGVIGIWYLHADQVYLDTGLTQSVFRPSGTYPRDIAAYSGIFATVSHWTDWGDPQNGLKVSGLLARFWRLHLTPLGVAVVALGLFRYRTPRRTVIDVWLLAVLALAGVL